MKVLIAYVSAGAGHRKAAEALYDYLREARPDLELKLVDILDYSSPAFKFFYSPGYVFVISKLPWLWYFLYRASLRPEDNTSRVFMDCLNCRGFLSLLSREKPDCVVSTHFLASGMISALKKRELKSLKLITIVTDYNLHPYWVGDGVDLYFVSCDQVKQDLLGRKVEPQKIRVSGIPAGKKFYLSCDRKAAAAKLGVDVSAFTVLVITGAIGIGPIEEIVKALAGEVQLLVVCGKNKKLYSRLNTLNIRLLKAYPLINNVDELMSVSDLVLTKAGGLTITECLAKSLPMVFFSSIPGLETKNADIVVSYGAGFSAKTVGQIKDTILSLKNDPAVYQRVLSNVKLLRRENTLKDISLEI